MSIPPKTMVLRFEPETQMYFLRVDVGLPCLSHGHYFCPESTNLETYQLGNLSINLNISKHIETTRLTKADLKFHYEFDEDILRLCAHH